MKYAVATGDCCSPKSPTVILFPPVWSQSEAVESQPAVRDVNMATSDRCADIESQTSYADVADVHRGYHGNPIPASPSTIQLIPNGKHILSHRPKLSLPPCRGSFDSCETASNNSGNNRQSSSRCSFLIIAAMFLMMSGLIGYMFYSVFSLQKEYDSLKNELNNMKTSQAMLQEEPKICMPCDDLSQGPFVEDNPDFDDLLRQEENGRTMCCAKSNTQTSILLNLFAKRKQLEKCAQELLKTDNRTNAPCNHTCITGNTPPRPTSGAISAHLQVGVQPDQAGVNSDGSHGQPIRNWLADKPGTHLKGIQIAEDRLFVPETGLYFLYSQVSFLVFHKPDEEPDTDGAQSLFHTVFRYNVIYPLGNEQLLKSGVTQCWETQKDYGRYTNYVGASLFLNKGDQIYVNVSKMKYLSTDPTMSYFGMFKLS